MDFFLAAKKKIVSKNTIEGYTKDLKIFEEWAEKTGFVTKPISAIGTQLKTWGNVCTTHGLMPLMTVQT